MANTKISWTATVNRDGTVTPGKVWNPITGCTEVSAGCVHCYARRMATRLQAMGQPHYKNGFAVTCHEDALDIPLHWRKPARIFVNSMSDLFHDDVPSEFILRAYRIMRQARQHTFMILTKRPRRMRDFMMQYPSTHFDFAPNIWLGVSVENQKAADERIPLLLQTPAAVRFLSCEPLLEELNLTIGANNHPMLPFRVHDFGKITSLIDWVIVGGESGPHYRPMNPDWARSIREQCKSANVPFFFKQMGGLHHGSDLLDGVEYKEFPR